jgi:hypothetical protein
MVHTENNFIVLVAATTTTVTIAVRSCSMRGFLEVIFQILFLNFNREMTIIVHIMYLWGTK